MWPPGKPRASALGCTLALLRSNLPLNGAATIALRLGAHPAQVECKKLVDSVPRVAQNVLAAEVVELAGIDHELDELTFVLLQRLIHQPHRLQEWHVYVGRAVQNEQRPRQ